MTQPPTVPPPPSGLGSSSNYYLYTNCNPIVDLSVTINVTEDIVCRSTSPGTPPCTPEGVTPDKGFGFQLNANSPSGETVSIQQYVIALWGGELIGMVDNWPQGLAASTIDDYFSLTSVPEALTLPAGYQLKIILRNNSWRTTWALAAAGSWAGPADSGLLLYDRFNGTGAFYAIGGGGGMDKLAQDDDWRTSWDLAVAGGWAGPGNSGLLLYDQSAGVGAFYAVDSRGAMTLLQQYDDSIAGATYIVTDNHGRVRADVTKILTSISGVNPAADLSPITAFQLNVVGPDNGGISVLSSGAGTIVYEASTPLTVLPSEPSCIDGGAVTCEAANTVYGLLPDGASTTFTQSFNVTQAPMIRKEGKVRLSLRVRPDSADSR
jgi:hypothetical protein